MLDIKFIRENKDIIRMAAEKKHIAVDLDRLIAIDEKRRTLIAEVDEMRRLHKEASEKVAGLEGDMRTALIQEVKENKDKLSHKEFELRTVEQEFDELMLEVPNVPDLSVPDGASDKDNQEIKAAGKQRAAKLDYLTLMQNLNMVDLERGTKVAGFRGYFLKNDGALLSVALWQFAFDRFSQKGFTPFLAPSLVKRENFVGTGWMGKASRSTAVGGVPPEAGEDVYKTQDDLYLAGTAEVAMMGYHADEILSETELPKKYVALSPCFRREAGSHGKDTKGIFRVHEFYKVEQVVLCRADHQESVRWHEELTQNAEELMKDLNIPYRVVVNCGGDLGLGQVKKYDIEGWLPSEQRYRETHSSSYFHDFQARRLGIKYRDAEGKIHFAHSLNNTAIATPRFLEVFLENNQTDAGAVQIPQALQHYIGKEILQ